MEERAKSTSHKGFTLLELLIVIVVVATLIALSVAGLSQARTAARTTLCLGHMRQLGTTLQQYWAASREVFPFAPAGTVFATSPPEDGPTSTAVSGNHFDLRVYWTTPVSRVAPWKENFVNWVCPSSKRMPGLPWKSASGDIAYPSYVYVFGFMARPSVWMDGSTANADQLRSVRLADVRFPSGKAAFFDQEMGHLPNRASSSEEFRSQSATPILFVDGHSTQRRLSEATKPATNPFTGHAWPLHDTRDGTAGCDF